MKESGLCLEEYIASMQPAEELKAESAVAQDLPAEIAEPIEEGSMEEKTQETATAVS